MLFLGTSFQTPSLYVRTRVPESLKFGFFILGRSFAFVLVFGFLPLGFFLQSCHLSSNLSSLQIIQGM
jgi:hypothetical protein